MTVARANEIQANIDKEYPEYGDVLKRKDEPKSKTEAAAAEEKILRLMKERLIQQRSR